MTSILLTRIGASMLVILAGFLGARRGVLEGVTVSRMNRLVIEVAFPALAFSQVLRTADATVLRAEWFVPLLGGGVMALACAVGALVALALRDPVDRRTAAFLVGVPNWIYLPLPVATALHGDAAARHILLSNMGVQPVLWTLGVWLLARGAAPAQGSVGATGVGAGLLAVLRIPGIWATAAGIVLGLLVPRLRALETASPSEPHLVAAAAVMQAIAMIGALTVPLALLLAGAQLHAMRAKSEGAGGPLAVVLAGRLLLAPLATAALLYALRDRLPPDLLRTMMLVGAMPVAVTCAAFVEQLGGNARLAARAIFLSTVLALATVPILMAAFAAVAGYASSGS